MNEIDSLYEILKMRALYEEEDRYILFHGTNIYFKEIDLNKPKETSDFGKGFYLTNILEQAVVWAGTRRRQTIVAERNDNGLIPIQEIESAYVLKYELSFEELRKLNLNIKVFHQYNREWLDAILLGRRHLGVNDDIVEDTSSLLMEYDIIAGPMADNSLEKKINKYIVAKLYKFVEEPYDRDKLLEEIQMERKNYQIVFRTKKSLGALSRLSDSFDMIF